LNSKDGHGRFLDEVVLTTLGLGGDPYETATLRAEKNRWYRYDLLWRRNDFFDPGLTTGGASGAHLLDTTYASQDHDLTLLPGSNVQFFLGYSHEGQSGAGVSTLPAFDPTASFPLFTNVRRARSEYRLGNELRFHGIRINWLHGWEDFKDDTTYQSIDSSSAAIPPAGGLLDSAVRTEPYHGTSPYWRVALFYDNRSFNVNGRFTYTAGRRAYLLDESASGLDRTGAAANRQVFSFGAAQRPVATGNLNITVLPARELTITNQTSVYNVRTEGNSVYTEVDNATQSVTSQAFQYLGIMTVANATDFTYRPAHWLGFYGGYHFSHRRIRSVQQAATAVDDQTNTLNAGLLGVRLSVAKGLTATAGGELGRNSMPFAPKSAANYHTITGRIQYRRRALQLAAWSKTGYNVNSVALSSYSSHARTYAGSGSWTPASWLSLDLSYSKLHLDTVGGIAYFIDPELIQGERSYYISNIHSGYGGARVLVKSLATIYLGYSIVQDTGDGRSSLFGNQVGSNLQAFQAAQTLPMRFHSPVARLSIRLTEKLRFNVGYEYYGYREDFYGAQDYRARTGYGSLQWSF
jgi:hypothetical protein